MKNRVFDAIIRGDNDAIRKLVDGGLDLKDPQIRDSRNRTPLEAAMEAGQPSIFVTLCRLGAQWQHKKSTGETLLQTAILESFDPVYVYALLSMGAEFESDVFEAAYKGAVDLLPTGFSAVDYATYIDSAGFRPAHYAVAQGHIDFLQSLVDLGVDIHQPAKGMMKETPLFTAIWAKQSATVVWLLAHGATVHERDSEGNSPLLCAISTGDMRNVRYLLNAGGSLTDTNMDGDNAISIAAHSGQIGMLRWLVSQGFSLYQKDSDGESIMMRAASNARLETVAWLLEQGFSLEECSPSTKMTPLSWLDFNEAIESFARQLEDCHKLRSLHALEQAVVRSELPNKESLLQTVIMPGKENIKHEMQLVGMITRLFFLKCAGVELEGPMLHMCFMCACSETTLIPNGSYISMSDDALPHQSLSSGCNYHTLFVQMPQLSASSMPHGINFGMAPR